MNTTMKKLTTREQIRNVFATNENKFLPSTDILAQVDAAKQTVYGTISAMANASPAELDRRGSEGGYEYRLPEATYRQMAIAAGAYDLLREEPQPILMQTESSDLSLPEKEVEATPAPQEQKEEAQPEVQPEVPVQVVPEGVSGVAIKKQKERQAYWRDEDREAFALNFARLQAEHPLRDFELLAAEAQADFPPEKRKTITKRGDISNWFEHFLNKARIQAKKEKEEQDKAEQEARLLEAMQEQEAQMRVQQGTMLQTMSNMDLFGEVLRRGQSMVETMLINALQSPNVQQAFLNTFSGGHGERRATPRHAFTAPEQERVRLERIGILGINKPIHQNQMKQRMQTMYDLRFGNVDGTAQQLTQAMAGCDVVIVLTDHIPHRTRAQLKAANIEFMSMSGDKRAAEEFLGKRYLEKNGDN
jgi:hypothetical protein